MSVWASSTHNEESVTLQADLTPQAERSAAGREGTLRCASLVCIQMGQMQIYEYTLKLKIR